jgi:transcriptional regulator with XRE-family HTH domain
MNGSEATAGPLVIPLAAERGSSARRIALGAQLRRLRETAGLSPAAAAAAIGGSTAKISRLERGLVRLNERDVADLLTAYRIVEAGERAEFLSLVRPANQPGWWQSYADLLPRWFETFLRLEQASSVIRTYELQVIPGLFQTPEYARAVTELGHPDPDEVERRVELRMRRQEVLTAPDAPVVWAVVDEAALRRPVAGPAVARSQLERLIELSELPTVRIQIAPFAAGGHAAAGGSFTILRFAQADLADVVYLEQLTSALYIEKRVDVEHYIAVMDRLCAQVEPPHRTKHTLSELRTQI